MGKFDNLTPEETMEKLKPLKDPFDVFQVFEAADEVYDRLGHIVYVFGVLRDYCQGGLMQHKSQNGRPGKSVLITYRHLFGISDYQDWFKALYEKLHEPEEEYKSGFKWIERVAVATVLRRCHFMLDIEGQVHDYIGFAWINREDWDLQELVKEWRETETLMKSGKPIELMIYDYDDDNYIVNKVVLY